MALINTIDVKDAQGAVEQEYLKFLQVRGEAPAFFRMFSASPGLLQAQGVLEDYYRGHPRLGFLLQGYIRMLSAHAAGFRAAADYHAMLLKTKGGIMPSWVRAPLKDPAQAPLPEKEKALLLFVLKAAKKPASVRQKDIEVLRRLDWEDGDILDALFLAVHTLSAKIPFEALDMDGS